MPYWRLFYHIVWATKGRQFVLNDADMRVLLRSLRTTLETFRAIPHSIGVMPDHIHVAVSIPPGVALSEVVGRMKGASAHALNHEITRPEGAIFSWQAEYGIFSFSEKALPMVVDYVEHQRERHASQELWASLENTGDTHKQPASAGLSE